MRRSLTNAKAPEAVDGGWYKGAIEQFEVVEASSSAKNPGTPMFKESFRILEGPFANRVLFQNWMIDEGVGGSHRTKKLLQELGHDPDNFDDEEVAGAVTGLECWAKVTKGTERDAERRENFGDFRNGISAHSLTDPEAGEAADTEQTPEAEQPLPSAQRKPNGVKGKAAQKPGTKAGKRSEIR